MTKERHVIGEKNMGQALDPSSLRQTLCNSEVDRLRPEGLVRVLLLTSFTPRTILVLWLQFSRNV